MFARGGSSAGQSIGLIIRGSWVQVPPALLFNTAFNLAFLGYRRPPTSLLITGGCSVVALRTVRAFIVNSDPRDDHQKIEAEGLHCVAAPWRPRDVQALSKSARLAGQAVRDQQIKDPLLLAAPRQNRHR